MPSHRQRSIVAEFLTVIHCRRLLLLAGWRVGDSACRREVSASVSGLNASCTFTTVQNLTFCNAFFQRLLLLVSVNRDNKLRSARVTHGTVQLLRGFSRFVSLLPRRLRRLALGVGLGFEGLVHVNGAEGPRDATSLSLLVQPRTSVPRSGARCSSVLCTRRGADVLRCSSVS